MFIEKYVVIAFHLLVAFKLDILGTRKVFRAETSVLKLSPTALTCDHLSKSSNMHVRL